MITEEKLRALVRAELEAVLADWMDPGTSPVGQARLLSCTQLCKVVGISRATLYRLRQETGFPSIRIFGDHRYRVADVMRWLGQRKERG